MLCGHGGPGVSRTHRVVSATSVSLASQVLVTVVGLWYTRFVLRQLGAHDLGLWLLGLQVTLYLALLDLGVVALLPRDVAESSGAADRAAGAVADVVGRSLRLVLWQLPVVAVAAAAVWVAAPEAWAALRAPLATILAVFVLVFPLRLLQGTLAGLQDLAFVGQVQTVAWMVGIATAAGMLVAGFGLAALSAGWAVAQLAPPVALWWRLRTCHPGVLPARLPRLAWRDVRATLGRSLWVSIGQLTHMAVVASDVLIIGALLGPAAVVPYVITTKLVAVFGNLPLSLVASATPALAEVRAREGGRRFALAVRGLAQAVLWVSGGLLVAVLALNRGFVELWVGEAQFGGLRLTLAVALVMLVRHGSQVLAQAVFAAGHVRALGVNGVVEAAAVIGLSLALVPALGPVGVPAASLIAVPVVVLPLVLRLHARDTGEPVAALLRPHAAWAWRLALLGAAGLAVARWRSPHGLAPFLAVCVAAALAYLALMLPLLWRQPVKGYLGQVVGPRWPRAGRWLRLS
jgi:O-antigen/teichoic acid export membrane protein